MSGFLAFAPAGEKRFRERFGLDFEQFAAGQRFRHRPGLTLSQQDSRDECLDTLNQQMLHFDEAFAAHTEWKRCLMDSTLTAKVVIGMTWKTFARRTRLLGFDEITLSRPLFGGATLYAESEILATGDFADDRRVGQVKVRTVGLDPAGAAVAALTWDVLVARASAADTARGGGDAAATAGPTERHGSHEEIAPGVFLERRGLFLEDVEVGETYEHRPGKTFSAEESQAHTLRALDQSPALVDAEFARRSLGAPPPINPMHVLAVLTGMMTKTFSRIVANLAWKNVRFHSDVLPGETVYAESTVLAKRPSQSRPGQGILHVRTTAGTADGRRVCTFERLILVYARGHGPYEAAGY